MCMPGICSYCLFAFVGSGVLYFLLCFLPQQNIETQQLHWVDMAALEE